MQIIYINQVYGILNVLYWSLNIFLSIFQQVKPSDLGIYEVLMRIRHREANKKHPFGINLQVCSVLLEDENLGNRFVSFIIFKLWLTMFF